MFEKNIITEHKQSQTVNGKISKLSSNMQQDTKQLILYILTGLQMACP